jgi:hypothetical protein
MCIERLFIAGQNFPCNQSFFAEIINMLLMSVHGTQEVWGKWKYVKESGGIFRRSEILCFEESTYQVPLYFTINLLVSFSMALSS